MPADLLLEGVRAAWPGEVVTDRGAVTRSDLYGLAESMPAGHRDSGIAHPWVHVQPDRRRGRYFAPTRDTTHRRPLLTL
jgi:hypothetical protein